MWKFFLNYGIVCIRSHMFCCKQVKQMGLYLHIKEGEDSYLWEVAEMALCAPMPEHWEEVVEGTPDAPHVTFRYVITITVLRLNISKTDKQPHAEQQLERL